MKKAKSKIIPKPRNKLHEVLEGQKQFTLLPQNEAFCLYHPKTIARQELQNAFYTTL